MTNDSASPSLRVVKSVYSTWGRHPRLYAAQDWVTFLGRHRAIRQRAAIASGVRRGDRVLEVACGTGRNFKYLEELIGPHGRLLGFDYSREMLAAAGELCSRRGWSNVELRQGDAAELDVGDEPFDAVISVLGLSAIPNHIAALERCHQMLRPGGVLSVCDARLFSGFLLRRLNGAVRAIYRRGAAWNADRDIPADIRRIFGNVSLETFNFGTFFIATAVREAAP